jgi:predicted ATP-grasp superfamily ATP-dependent carboligase
VNPVRAEEGWPPVVVASVFQTGLNLMRDLLRRGVRAVGVDCIADHEGFRSRYGTSHLCPNPDTHPDEWVAFMVRLAAELGAKPVIIPAADLFVTALGRHVEALKAHYTFSLESIAVQAALATKEQQYALAERFGLPIPRSTYIQCSASPRLRASLACSNRATSASGTRCPRATPCAAASSPPQMMPPPCSPTTPSPSRSAPR